MSHFLQELSPCARHLGKRIIFFLVEQRGGAKKRKELFLEAAYAYV